MQYRTLGRTQLKVSAISLGCWNIGGQWGAVSEADAAATLRRAYDVGITLFDTADAYGLQPGASETLMGRTLRDVRDQIVIVSKAGNWARRLGFPFPYTHPLHVVACCDASLYRLKTDYLDVLLCHIADLKDPTIFLEGFEMLKKQGKIRFYGISTDSTEVLAAFNARGTCDVVEFDYSLLNRAPEKTLLPYCQEHRIGTLARGGLAKGLLGGKYRETDTFSDEVRQGWNTGPAREQFVARLRQVEKIKPLANASRTVAQVALAYLLTHPAMHCIIPGAKSPAQVEANVAAANVTLSVDDLQRLRAIA